MIVNKFKETSGILHDIGVNIENILNTQSLANSDLGREIASMINNSSLTLELILTIINNSSGNKVWLVDNISNLPEDILNGDIVVKSSSITKSQIGVYTSEDFDSYDDSGYTDYIYVGGELTNGNFLSENFYYGGDDDKYLNNNQLDYVENRTLQTIVIESPFLMYNAFRTFGKYYCEYTGCGSVTYDEDRHLYVYTINADDFYNAIDNADVDNWHSYVTIIPAFITPHTYEEYSKDNSLWEETRNSFLNAGTIYTIYGISGPSSGIYYYNNTAKKILTEDDSSSFEPKLIGSRLDAVNSGITVSHVIKYDNYNTSKQNKLNQNQLNAVNSTITLDKVTKYNDFINSHLNNIFVVNEDNPVYDYDLLKCGDILIYGKYEKQLIHTESSENISNRLGYWENSSGNLELTVAPQQLLYLTDFLILNKFCESIIIESPHRMYSYVYLYPNEVKMDCSSGKDGNNYVLTVYIENVLSDAQTVVEMVKSGKRFLIDPAFYTDTDIENVEDADKWNEINSEFLSYDYVYKVYAKVFEPNSIYVWNGLEDIEIARKQNTSISEQSRIVNTLNDLAALTNIHNNDLYYAKQDKCLVLYTTRSTSVPLTSGTLVNGTINLWNLINNEQIDVLINNTDYCKYINNEYTDLPAIPLYQESGTMKYVWADDVEELHITNGKVYLINENANVTTARYYDTVNLTTIASESFEVGTYGWVVNTNNPELSGFKLNATSEILFNPDFNITYLFKDSGITSEKVALYDSYAAGKQNTLSEQLLFAVNSGITSSKVALYDNMCKKTVDVSIVRNYFMLNGTVEMHNDGWTLNVTNGIASDPFIIDGNVNMRITGGNIRYTNRFCFAVYKNDEWKLTKKFITTDDGTEDITQTSVFVAGSNYSFNTNDTYVTNALVTSDYIGCKCCVLVGFSAMADSSYSSLGEHPTVQVEIVGDQFFDTVKLYDAMLPKHYSKSVTFNDKVYIYEETSTDTILKELNKIYYELRGTCVAKAKKVTSNNGNVSYQVIDKTHADNTYTLDVYYFEDLDLDYPESNKHYAGISYGAYASGFNIEDNPYTCSYIYDDGEPVESYMSMYIICETYYHPSMYVYFEDGEGLNEAINNEIKQRELCSWKEYNTIDNSEYYRSSKTFPSARNGTWEDDGEGTITGYIDITQSMGNRIFDLRKLDNLSEAVVDIDLRGITNYETIIYYRGSDTINLNYISPLTVESFSFLNNEPLELDTDKEYVISIQGNTIAYGTLTKGVLPVVENEE